MDWSYNKIPPFAKEHFETVIGIPKTAEKVFFKKRKKLLTNGCGFGKLIWRSFEGRKKLYLVN